MTRLSIQERMMNVADGVAPPASKVEQQAIDREKTCPLLLRVFVSDNGRHHRPEEFSRGNLPGNELQIYTWMDASLKELSNLVKEVRPDARKKGTIFKFQTVFFHNMAQRFKSKDIGQTMSGSKGDDDSITLESCKFQIGDYMDVCIIHPREGRRY